MSRIGSWRVFNMVLRRIWDKTNSLLCQYRGPPKTKSEVPMIYIMPYETVY